MCVVHVCLSGARSIQVQGDEYRVCVVPNKTANLVLGDQIVPIPGVIHTPSLKVVCINWQVVELNLTRCRVRVVTGTGGVSAACDRGREGYGRKVVVVRLHLEVGRGY